MKQYFTGEHICLRAVEPEDLQVMYEMENDPSMWDVSNFNVPYSKYVLRQYIENSQYDLFADKQLRLMVVERQTGRVAGTLDVSDFAPMHCRGDVGIALRSDFRGKGYAREALQLLCDYCFGFLHMKQLTAHVGAGNEASLQLFRSCGFVPCGHLKEWWRMEDGYVDVALLQKVQ